MTKPGRGRRKFHAKPEVFVRERRARFYRAADAAMAPAPPAPVEDAVPDERVGTTWGDEASRAARGAS